jgi:hypothetical protein
MPSTGTSQTVTRIYAGIGRRKRFERCRFAVSGHLLAYTLFRAASTILAQASASESA